MTDAPDGLDMRAQIAHIDRMLADAARKRREVTDQPWIFMLSGMTAGAALFAAGAAVFKLLT
jgi:hypothetical protein